MRKPVCCKLEDKVAYQLCGSHTADQRLCFLLHRLNNSSTFKIRYFKPLAISCGCRARFVLDLVGNPKDRFSHDAAHLIAYCIRSIVKNTHQRHTL